MKFQVLALLAPAVLGAAVPSDASANLESRQTFGDFYNTWVCASSTGGGGSAALKKVHQGFNKVWGTSRLTLKANQCVAAECGGYYFSVCNHSDSSKTETSNMRNVAAARDPKSGDLCITTNQANMNVMYYYGKGKFETAAGSITRKTC
ncbi:hypothetical protein V8F20_010906 [Naviculisporaceae sp. PSN 640]